MRVAFLFIQIPKAKNESIQTKMGQWISWTCLLLVLLICCDVFLRYVLNTSKTWMVDLEWQLFSLLFLWWAGATWLADKHVQVDLFYSNWSLKRKVLVNNVGTVFLLLPWCAIIIFTSASYA
jgi:TRAP-type mannitol/chloroaromatic compound transport system permease small subunit